METKGHKIHSSKSKPCTELFDVTWNLLIILVCLSMASFDNFDTSKFKSGARHITGSLYMLWGNMTL